MCIIGAFSYPALQPEYQQSNVRMKLTGASFLNVEANCNSIRNINYANRTMLLSSRLATVHARGQSSWLARSTNSCMQTSPCIILP